MYERDLSSVRAQIAGGGGGGGGGSGITSTGNAASGGFSSGAVPMSRGPSARSLAGAGAGAGGGAGGSRPGSSRGVSAPVPTTGGDVRLHTIRTRTSPIPRPAGLFSPQPPDTPHATPSARPSGAVGRADTPTAGTGIPQSLTASETSIGSSSSEETTSGDSSRGYGKASLLEVIGAKKRDLDGSGESESEEEEGDAFLPFGSGGGAGAMGGGLGDGRGRDGSGMGTPVSTATIGRTGAGTPVVGSAHRRLLQRVGTPVQGSSSNGHVDANPSSNVSTSSSFSNLSGMSIIEPSAH